MTDEQKKKLDELKKKAQKAKMIKNSHFYNIVWDNAALPVIECRGADIIRCWEDVMAVAFDTCFIDKEQKRGFLFKG